MVKNAPMKRNSVLPVKPWRARIAILLLAIIGTGWLGWSAWFHSRPALTIQEIAFTITSESSTELRYEVTRREPDRPIICVLRALDSSAAVVGEVRETIPGETGKAASSTAARRTIIATLGRAAFVKVDRCWVTR
ncbi:MAG: hypothetical protein CK545_00040 [Actinobacteria bacterium]|nr:MAG: hypothetical protein CK545_00040 [Actinomycetota bacterium]